MDKKQTLLYKLIYLGSTLLHHYYSHYEQLLSSFTNALIFHYAAFNTPTHAFSST